MNRQCCQWFVLPIAAALALGGCGKSQAVNGHAGHDTNGQVVEESALRFTDGKGLEIPAEIGRALGLKTTEVSERTIPQTYEATAVVFDAGPPARASSIVPVAIADDLEKQPPTVARLFPIRRDISPALEQAEIVLTLPGTPKVGTTVNITLPGQARLGIAVPRSSLLNTVTGAFVYVVDGAFLKRTPVKTGADDTEFVEIIDGLHAGEVVATTAVEQLWLTELRLTKGGSEGP